MRSHATLSSTGYSILSDHRASSEVTLVDAGSILIGSVPFLRRILSGGHFYVTQKSLHFGHVTRWSFTWLYPRLILWIEVLFLPGFCTAGWIICQCPESYTFSSQATVLFKKVDVQELCPLESFFFFFSLHHLSRPFPNVPAMQPLSNIGLHQFISLIHPATKFGLFPTLSAGLIGLSIEP